VAIAVQQATASGWQTVARIRTRAGGVYDTALVHPGTYRIVYQGLNGPTVKVRSG
jgi:hypothetical protein